MSTPVITEQVPKGLAVKLIDLTRARESYKYLHVQNSREKTVSSRTPTGMGIVWKKPENRYQVYDDVTRLCGTIDDIFDALDHLGMHSEQEGLEGRVMTYDNYLTTMADVYEAECAAYQAYAASHKKAPETSRYTLQSLILMLKEYKKVSVPISGKAVGTKRATRGGRSRTQTLKEKFDNLPDGKFLDVTKYNVTDKKGAVVTGTCPAGATSLSGRTPKRYIQDIPIIGVPKNAEAYKAAVYEIFGNEHGRAYYEEWMALCDRTVTSKKAQPKRSGQSVVQNVVARTQVRQQPESIHTPVLSTRSRGRGSAPSSPSRSNPGSPGSYHGSPVSSRRSAPSSPVTSPAPVLRSRTRTRRGRSQQN